MTSLPVVPVYNPEDISTSKQLALPGVFQAPIRLDVVQFVHTNISKNRIQAHGVDTKAGMRHSAESWGPGRAVARIPRISGSGTHRSGQAAFGNQTRKGRMFAPIKTWRRWHRKVNLKQKRHAVASALAASALTPLVQARGHKVDKLPQVPFVVDDKLESYEKTKDAIAFLKKVGADQDVDRVTKAKTLRAGKGKIRNRRYKLKKGPLVVYFNNNVKLLQAFRNVPGVEICNVNRLNLKQLAPGGQLGRFIIWTASAFAHLDKLFGSHKKAALLKTGYNLNTTVLSNADITKIINSNEVQEAVKLAKESKAAHSKQKKNPLKNVKLMEKLNPNSKLIKKANKEDTKKNLEAKLTKKVSKEEKAARQLRKKNSKKYVKAIHTQIDDAAAKDIAYEEKEKAWLRGEDVQLLEDEAEE